MVAQAGVTTEVLDDRRFCDQMDMSQIYIKWVSEFANNCRQMQWCDNLENVFGVLQPQLGRVIATFYNRRINLHPCQHN